MSLASQRSCRTACPAVSSARASASASLGKEETAPPEALPYKRRLSYRTAAEEARVEAAKPTRMRCSGAHSSGSLIGMWSSCGKAEGVFLA